MQNKNKLLIILLVILLIFIAFNAIKKINNKNKFILKNKIELEVIEREINNAYKITSILSGEEKEKEMVDATVKSLIAWELFVGEYKDNQPVEYKKTKNWNKKIIEILIHEKKADELVKEKKFIMASQEIEKSREIFKKIKQENGILDISEEMVAFYKSAQKILDANTKEEVENNLLKLKYNFTVLKEYNIDDDYAKFISELEKIIADLDKLLDGPDFRKAQEKLKPIFLDLYMKY